MNINILIGILIPFIGTTLGSSAVFFMKDTVSNKCQSILAGFAAGVMVAASIYSLLNPAIEASLNLGKLSFLPAVIGFWIGILFLLALDHLIPHLHWITNDEEGPQNKLKRTTKLILAVTLHNIPEGMAIGVVFASYISGNIQTSFMSAFALSIGIAIQNFPEGAIISMPLLAEGKDKKKAFYLGTLSGIVEPIGALLTILFAQLVTSLLPYFLSFAAGAMMYVVVEELIPEMVDKHHSNVGTIFFSLGFTLMMALDIALG